MEEYWNKLTKLEWAVCLRTSPEGNNFDCQCFPTYEDANEASKIERVENFYGSRMFQVYSIYPDWLKSWSLKRSLIPRVNFMNNLNTQDIASSTPTSTSTPPPGTTTT